MKEFPAGVISFFSFIISFFIFKWWGIFLSPIVAVIVFLALHRESDYEIEERERKEALRLKAEEEQRAHEKADKLAQAECNAEFDALAHNPVVLRLVEEIVSWYDFGTPHLYFAKSGNDKKSPTIVEQATFYIAIACGENRLYCCNAWRRPGDVHNGFIEDNDPRQSFVFQEHGYSAQKDWKKRDALCRMICERLCEEYRRQGIVSNAIYEHSPFASKNGSPSRQHVLELVVRHESPNPDYDPNFTIASW